MAYVFAARDDEPTLRLVAGLLDAIFIRLQRRMTPKRVRVILEHWHYAEAKVATTDDDIRTRHPKKRPAIDPEKARVDDRADIARCLQRLTQLDHDPIAADCIRAYYGIQHNGQPRWRRDDPNQPDREDIGQLADFYGVSERTIYRYIARGTDTIAVMLGWLAREEDAE